MARLRTRHRPPRIDPPSCLVGVMTDNAAMDVLIIGGSGYVTGHLARAARDRGDRVAVLTRGSRPLPAGVRGVQADRHDAAAWERALREAGDRWDLVVDGIAFTGADGAQAADFRDRCGAYVLLSTEGVYAAEGRTVPVAETFDRFDTAPYGSGKRAAERAVMAHPIHRLPWTILRPGHIYGPGSELGPLPHSFRDRELLARLRADQPLRLVGGGRWRLQPIWIGDLLDLVLACAHTPAARGAVANAPGFDTLSGADYYRTVAAALGREARIEAVDPAEFLREQPHWSGVCCERVYADAARTAAGLPAPRMPLRDGVRRVIAWIDAGRPPLL